MTRARRLVRWSASSLVALLVLLVIGVGITQTAWFRNWVRMQLVVRATAALDGELRVSRLGGSLWTGVTLDNVEVWHRSGRVLSADRIRVVYNPWSLLRRQWIIDHVVIDRADIGVMETSEGWNILHLTRTPKQAREAPALIAIRRLELSDTDVTVTTSSGAARRITDVTMDGSVRVEHGVMGVRVDEFTGYDEATGLTVRELSGQASDNFRSFRAEVLADSPNTRIEGVVSGSTTATGRTVDANLDVVGVDLRRLTGDRRLASNITGHVVALGTLAHAGKPAHATFAFSGRRNTALGYTADLLDATGSVNRDRVTFDARVTAYGARASVAGTWRFGRNRAAGDFTGRGRFARVDLRRLPARWRLPALDSALAGRFDVTTGRGGWRAHATLDASVVEGARVAAGTEGSVTIADGVTRYAAIGGVQDLNLQRLSGPIRIPRFAEPRFASDLNGRFYVVGHEAATSPRLVFGGAVLEDSTFSGTHLPALTASAYLADRALTVEARGAFEDLNPTTLGTRASMALDGSVDGWFVVRDLDQPWTEHNIEGDGLVVLKDSVIENVAIDAGTIDGRLADGVATVRTIDLRGPDATLRVDGALGLDTKLPNSGLTVAADVPDLTGIGRHLGKPLTGAAAIQATVTGTTMSPSASGDVTLQQAAYGNAVSALTSTTRFNAAWPDRQSDKVTWDATTDATFVQIGNTKIQHLAATVAGSLREMNVDIRAEQQERSLGLEGRVTLLPDSRELLLRSLALTTQNVAWSLPAGQNAIVRYGTDTIDVSDLTLVRGEQHIGVSGSFRIGASESAAPDRATSLNVVIRGVELNDVNQALLGTRQLSGRLDGTIAVSGTRKSPTVDAQIVARDGTVEGVPFASVDTRGRYRDRRLTFDVTLDQAPGAQLKATGTMPVGAAAGADGLDVTVTGGPVNVGLIQALTTEIDNVAGSATLDVRITGSTAAPSVDGKVAIASGAFSVHATGARYQNLDADFTFAGSHLTIGRLQVADADGDLLTAEGGLDVLGEVGRRAVDMRVRADKFGVLRNQLGNADIDVDLGITGTLSALTVRGTAELDSGRLEVAEILERTTSTPYSTTPQGPLDAKTPAAERPSPSLLDRVNIDVQLRLPDNLVLRGRGLRVSNAGFGIGDMNIVTGGSFDVRKPPGADVEVLGTLQVVRGSYTFQGRRFDIVGGSDVRFRGGPLSDPSLNVSATREVSGITAEVRLRGTARSPQVTIASQPPLDEGEILSLIVFNQPINSLGAAERVNLGERAASMAAGAIASPLADSIARALNLDMLEIQAPTSEQSAGAVTVGGRLGSRLFVGLRQQFGRDESSLLTLEYRVNEVLRFVTSVARGTLQAHATRRMDQGGVDLIFVIRY